MARTTLHTRLSVVLNEDERRSLVAFLDQHCSSCCLDDSDGLHTVTAAVISWLALHMPESAS